MGPIKLSRAELALLVVVVGLLAAIDAGSTGLVAVAVAGMDWAVFLPAALTSLVVLWWLARVHAVRAESALSYGWAAGIGLGLPWRMVGATACLVALGLGLVVVLVDARRIDRRTKAAWRRDAEQRLRNLTGGLS